MIRNTFSILQGIGEKSERRLWKSGILTWEDFINSNGGSFISPPKKKLFDEHLTNALRELSEENSGYFSGALKRNEHWRLYNAFKKGAVCLDIETNGYMPGGGGYVTAVGLYDGFDYRCLIRGRDLSAENLRNAISGYKYLITFYGSVFDIPFIERAISGVVFGIPHFDLCFGARRLGLKGGLKRLEAEFGIERPPETKGMDGYDAVRLWERGRRGSAEALELLIMYNREDTVNLYRMADIIYKRLRARTGIEEYL
jgi:uncharacterized protein YprB with RNaseH-like and TPR domain